VAAVAAIAAGCGGSGAKSAPQATVSVGASNRSTTTVCPTAGNATGSTSSTVCGVAGGAARSQNATSNIKLRLTIDGMYKGQTVKGTVIPGSLMCATITTGGKHGLQVTWGGTVNGVGQVSGDMMFAGGTTSVTFGDNKSQGEASLVVKGDYQNRYGASSATGSGTENAKAGYSGGTIDGVLWDGDTASAPNMHLQGDWDC
jgi:hypothetical protein